MSTGEDHIQSIADCRRLVASMARENLSGVGIIAFGKAAGGVMTVGA